MNRTVLLLCMAGPAALLLCFAGLSLVQYDFMRGLGWHPVRAATFDWPSGLALGPYGWLMTFMFVACGMSIAALAIQTHQLVRARSLLIGLLLAAFGMAGLAFTTDPTLTTKVATWHGRLHDLSFVLLGAGLFVSWLAALMSLRPISDTLWKLTWLAIASVPLGFVVRGMGFYVFLFLALSWFQVLAFTLLRKPLR